MALYQITTTANVRDVPHTANSKILHKLPPGAIIQGAIVTGQNTNGSANWVNTPEGWFIHTSALKAMETRQSTPGDILAWAEGKLIVARDEAAWYQRLVDELGQTPQD